MLNIFRIFVKQYEYKLFKMYVIKLFELYCSLLNVDDLKHPELSMVNREYFKVHGMIIDFIVRYNNELSGYLTIKFCEKFPRKYDKYFDEDNIKVRFVNGIYKELSEKYDPYMQLIFCYVLEYSVDLKKEMLKMKVYIGTNMIMYKMIMYNLMLISLMYVIYIITHGFSIWLSVVYCMITCMKISYIFISIYKRIVYKLEKIYTKHRVKVHKSVFDDNKLEWKGNFYNIIENWI